jgi:hypothetical protein
MEQNGKVEHTGSVLGTSLVVALADATVGGHLDEVESTVQTAGKVGDINIEGKLLVDQVKHLVLGVGLHKVGTGSNVAGVLALGDKLEGQGIAASGDTVGTWTVSAVSSMCNQRETYQSSRHRQWRSSWRRCRRQGRELHPMNYQCSSWCIHRYCESSAS